jgi:uncharacterized protein
MMPGNSFDTDGRFTIPNVPLSANIRCYSGREILANSKYERTDIDPHRTYRLLRDPSELLKAAQSFRGVPLLSRHAGLSTIDPRLVVWRYRHRCCFLCPLLTVTVTLRDRQHRAHIRRARCRPGSPPISI